MLNQFSRAQLLFGQEGMERLYHARVGNFVPAISLEGFEAATDDRRGAGVYLKVQQAMQLLRRKSCSTAFPPATPAPISAPSPRKNIMTASLRWARISSGISITCRWATTPRRSCCRYLHINANGDVDPCENRSGDRQQQRHF